LHTLFSQFLFKSIEGDYHFIRLEKLEEEKEVAKDMATFLHKPTGIEAATKCMCQFAFHDSMTVMSNKTENQLYRLQTQEKKEAPHPY